MSLLKDDSMPFPPGVTIPGNPLRPWTQDDMRNWVASTVEHYSREFYSVWTLADICGVESSRHCCWIGNVEDDLTCWELRLESLRAALRARGDGRADQPCSIPSWLRAPDLLRD